MTKEGLELEKCPKCGLPRESSHTYFDAPKNFIVCANPDCELFCQEPIDSIDESITGELQPVAEYETIEDKDKAVMVLERIGTREAAIRKLQETHMKRNQPLRDKIEINDKWYETEKAKLDKEISWLANPLEFYMRAYHARYPKKKSLPLPTGILHLRKKPDKVEIAEGFDPVKALIGREEPEGLVKEKIECYVDKKAVKEYIEAQVGTLSWAKVITGETEFSWEVTDG